ncbi:MAG: hypothetical protein AAF196_20000, partial [Planctomycetota bacterium]
FRQLLDDIPLAGVRLQAPVDLSEVAELAAACLAARRRPDSAADLATLSQQLESISVIERRFDAHRFDAETNLDADVDGALDQRWNGVRELLLKTADFEAAIENATSVIALESHAEITADSLLQELLNRLPAERVIDDTTAAETVLTLLQHAGRHDRLDEAAQEQAQILDQIARGFFHRSVTPQRADQIAEESNKACSIPLQPERGGSTLDDFDQLFADIQVLPDPEIPENLVGDLETIDALITCFTHTRDQRTRSNALGGVSTQVEQSIKKQEPKLIEQVAAMFQMALPHLDDDGYSRLWGDETVLGLLLRRHILSVDVLASRLPLGVSFLLDQVSERESPALSLLQRLCETCAGTSREALRLAVSVAFVARPDRAHAVLEHFEPPLKPLLGPISELTASDPTLTQPLIRVLRSVTTSGTGARWIRLAPDSETISSNYLRKFVGQVLDPARAKDLVRAAAYDLNCYFQTSDPSAEDEQRRVALVRYTGEFRDSSLRDTLRGLDSGGLFKLSSESRAVRRELRKLLRDK